jgi:hypothetical protein
MPGIDSSGRLSSEPEAGTLNKSDFPSFLTIHEAVAWVQFRSLDAVSAAKTPDGLAGFRIWAERPLKGSIVELQQALSEGIVSARGQTNGGSWVTIDPVEWVALPLAPLVLKRQWPYKRIQIPRDQLLTCFPTVKVHSPRGRPPSYDWHWIKKAAAEETGSPGQSKLGEILIARYEEQFGHTISRSSMARNLKAWGY